jgi:hypothetical protein
MGFMQRQSTAFHGRASNSAAAQHFAACRAGYRRFHCEFAARPGAALSLKRIRFTEHGDATVDKKPVRQYLNKASAPACGIAVVITAASGLLSLALAGDLDSRPPLPVHFTGLLNDYTPSAAVVKGGPYEMRGKWSLEVDERRGTATFSAALNMETSDYGIVQNTVNKDDPTTRGAHTHHISMTDGVISEDWASSCPAFSPPVTGGFVVSGPAFITGNGGPAPFGNPSHLTLCVLGGNNVSFSNITLTLGLPASSHFGKQPVHGVVLTCGGPWEHESRDCTVQQ